MATIRDFSQLAAGTRVRCPPGTVHVCPRCGGSSWHNYRYVPDAPVVGCGTCGFLVYLTTAYFSARNNEIQEVKIRG